MKACHLVTTEPAESNLKEIANYIAMELREPPTAQHMITKISETIFELEQMPKRNALVGDERLANQGIRKLVGGNYIVFEENKSVSIIRILYGRRDWNNLL